MDGIAELQEGERPGEIRWGSYVTFVPAGEFDHIIPADGSAFVRVGSVVFHFLPGTNVREIMADNENPGSRRGAPPAEGTTEQLDLSIIVRRSRVIYIPPGSMLGATITYIPPGTTFLEHHAHLRRGHPAIEGRTYQNGLLRPVPYAARSFVDGLPSTSIEQSQLGDGSVVCSICLDVMVSGGLFKKLPCLHSYHKNCIMKWVESHSTCPLCRFELSRDNIQHTG